jgi:DnaJ like chaperone protein
MGISELMFRHLEHLVRLQQAFAPGSPEEGERIEQRPPAKRSALDHAYAILGVEREATDAEVKRAYRRLLSRHHPDKLVSKGLPEEMMKLAAEKTHEIRQAYETITRARGDLSRK